MTSYLVAHGIKNILVACPNCQAIFSQYAKALNTRTIYESLDEITGTTRQPEQTVTIHDPCVTRFQETTQTAVRSLLQKQGFKVKEPLTQREKDSLLRRGGRGHKSRTEILLELGRQKIKRNRR